MGKCVQTFGWYYTHINFDHVSNHKYFPYLNIPIGVSCIDKSIITVPQITNHWIVTKTFSSFQVIFLFNKCYLGSEKK